MKLGVLNMYLDFAYLAGVIFFSILFYFDIKIIFLTNFVIISSFISLSIKLINWYNTSKIQISDNSYNKHKYFFLRFVSCVLIYIAPVYCIIQEPNLIVSHFIAMITFAIVSLSAIIGVIIERKFIMNENIDT